MPSISYQRSGLTLLEVVASLLLLSTLLVAILLAFGRHARQIRTAQDKLSAVEATDRMLALWLSESGAVPRDSDGLVPDAEHLGWRTNVATSAEAEMLGVEIVRVEVRPTDAVDASGDGRPLVAVDVVVGGRQDARE